MEIDIDRMKIARRLNGTLINGYAGCYGHLTDGEDDYLIIAIPHSSGAVDRLMKYIDIKH